ncbi:hypothetical protein [Mycetocola tolaasinivorans]|uniref:hypothetical protein n=1 Tax=Mycetocola tolaasinivorans TaxID=76635 RepID=UPI0015FF95B4|nr:hypothetical protein [Mycetocola tolaasinivorans]
MVTPHKVHPETGALLILFEQPFATEAGRTHFWVDDEGQQYPVTAAELAHLRSEDGV